jgi:hypothetical protein
LAWSYRPETDLSVTAAVDVVKLWMICSLVLSFNGLARASVQTQKEVNAAFDAGVHILETTYQSPPSWLLALDT